MSQEVRVEGEITKAKGRLGFSGEMEYIFNLKSDGQSKCSSIEAKRRVGVQERRAITQRGHDRCCLEDLPARNDCGLC